MAVAAVLVATGAGCDRGSGAHVVTGDLRGVEDAVFELVSGADMVVVRSQDLDGRMYWISTPREAQGRPTVTERDGIVSTSLTGEATVEVLLSDDVRWTVRIDGGSREQLIDLSAAPIGDLDLRGGANRITVALPRNDDDATTVRMSGGASEFGVLAPSGVPVRVSLAGGAGSARVDGETRAGIAGGTVFGPVGWDTAAGRYDIQALAGVSGFTLDRR